MLFHTNQMKKKTLAGDPYHRTISATTQKLQRITNAM